MSTDEDFVYDAGDEGRVEFLKERSEIERERQLEELRVILETSGGRNLLWRVLSWCGVYNSTSATDPIYMAILSGKRDIGLQLLVDIMESDPTAYIKMQAEGKERNDRLSE
jgi:hypothetical protein